MRIAEEAARLQVPLMVVTNGTLLTEKFLADYRALGHKLTVSIDTLDREKWHDFRGRDHYDLVFTNVEIACRILGDNLLIQSVLA